ncbi:MAG: hypothetical protein ACOYEV_05035 [Candidatus Nanopelagicales bacterium]
MGSDPTGEVGRRWAMDAVVVFACLFVPTFLLNYLGAGRAEMLMEGRSRTHPAVVAAACFAAVVLVHLLGFSWSWAVVLVIPGPLGAVLGESLGHGGGVIARFRFERIAARMSALLRRGG